RRRTLFAFWAVGELAKAVAREKELRTHVPIRQNPLFDVTETAARCDALSLSAPLTPELHQLLAPLKDRRSLPGAPPALGLAVEAVERMALPLLRCAFLLRGLPFEPNAFETFEGLRRSVQALPECAARALWLDRLTQLETLRASFEAAPLAQRRTLLAE